MGREWQWIPLFSSPTMEGKFESYILTQVATNDLSYHLRRFGSNHLNVSSITNLLK